MKKKIIVALGLAVLSTPAFVKGPEIKFVEPEPSPPIQIPESNDFIRRKMAEARRRKK